MIELPFEPRHIVRSRLLHARITDTILFELPLARRRPANFVQPVTAAEIRMSATHSYGRRQRNVARFTKEIDRVSISPTVRTSRLARKGAVHTYISSGRTPRTPDRRRRSAYYRRYSPSQKGESCECECEGQEESVGRMDKSRRRSGVVVCVLSAGACESRLRSRFSRPIIAGAVADSFHSPECSCHTSSQTHQYPRVVGELIETLMARQSERTPSINTWRTHNYLAVNGHERR